MIEDIYPLSPLQEGMYYYWLSSEGSSNYFKQMSYQLKGRLHVDFLEKSYQQLVARHAILRTFFTQDFGEQALQVVRKDTPSNFIYKSIFDSPGFTAEDYKELDRAKGFDLHSGSQMRLTVLDLGNDTYEFIWSHHHIIMDGWCLGILIKEFFQIYQSMVDGMQTQLPPVYPYSSYIAWLMKNDKQASLDYWKNYLSGYDTVSSLPKIASGKHEYMGREAMFQLDDATRQGIKSLCSEYGITENTFIQTAWGILLGKYNGTNDVVFGSIVSGRPAAIPGIEDMVGLFINTVPVRLAYDDQTSVADLLKDAQQKSIEGVDHHYTQLAQIQAASGVSGNLFDHLVQFQNMPVQEMVKQNMKNSNSSEELSLLSFQASGDNTFDFTCIVSPGATIGFKFRYNEHLYDEATIERIQLHLGNIIGAMVADPSNAVNEIEFISEAEKEQLLCFGISSVEYDNNKTVVQLFEEQVEKTPESIALVFQNVELTYRELNNKANQLANLLINNYSIGKNDLVGIMLDRSEKMIIAILGIMKAGAAYVAIDSEFPKARKEHIVQETALKALITQSDNIFDLDYYNGNVFAIDIQLNDDAGTEAPATVVELSDLAYVIYTSGSTGKPKGVMITHEALADYVFGVIDRTNILDCKTFGLVSTIAADLGNTVLYPALVTGGALHVFSAAEVMSAEKMAGHKIDCLKIVPSHWKALQQENAVFAPAKCLVFGGEELTNDVVSLLKAGNKDCKVYNHYGPSETTIGKLIRPIDLENEATISLGAPFCNSRVYITDDAGKLVPVGVAGEILIGGKGLSKGYLNNEQLTAERFIADPFVPGELVYKTGDLGKWLSDGTIGFLGRKDDQIKIRGYRIELGEIAGNLLTYEGITSAIVLANSAANGEKELVAYVVSKLAIHKATVEKHLSQRLPAYMLPHKYVELTEMPLNANGKIDRKKLLLVTETKSAAAVEYVAPRNEVDDKLVAIWKEILDRDNIGIRDNFFTLGGHSLKVVQLISRINTSFLVRIDIQDIFRDATIESISEQISFILDQNTQKQNTGNFTAIEI